MEFAPSIPTKTVLPKKNGKPQSKELLNPELDEGAPRFSNHALFGLAWIMLFAFAIENETDPEVLPTSE